MLQRLFGADVHSDQDISEALTWLVDVLNN